MRVRMMVMAAATMLAACSVAPAALTVHTFEDLDEGFTFGPWTHNGITYRDVNNVPGVFPTGETFVPTNPETFEGLGDAIIVEDATFLYNDFPDWGSANKALTFGYAFVPGPNLSIGAISNVTMELAAPADSASLEMVYYENGPWSGIVYHLDGLLNGQVVASDSFTVAGDDVNGRDSLAFAELSISGATFDTLKLYATFGNDYSGPRIMIDNLTINSVPEAGSAVMLGAPMAALLRRRRGR